MDGLDDLMSEVDATTAAEAEAVLQKAGVQLPKDADEWLRSFIAIADTVPACIVISDMTIRGCPMVFVNNEFCRVTQYSKSEATGRNCRFLQGPDTEAEAISVIRSTLSKAEDCQVKLTNYRKDGEKFQNLLTMRPVFDTDNVYRYVIGVQFEIVEDEDLKARVSLLERLLQLLPRQLPLRSKAAVHSARTATLKEYFRLRSVCCVDRTAWRGIVEEAFVHAQPRLPYRSQHGTLNEAETTGAPDAYVGFGPSRAVSSSAITSKRVSDSDSGLEVEAMDEQRVFLVGLDAYIADMLAARSAIESSGTNSVGDLEFALLDDAAHGIIHDDEHSADGNGVTLFQVSAAAGKEDKTPPPLWFGQCERARIYNSGRRETSSALLPAGRDELPSSLPL